MRSFEAVGTDVLPEDRISERTLSNGTLAQDKVCANVIVLLRKQKC